MLQNLLDGPSQFRWKWQTNQNFRKNGEIIIDYFIEIKQMYKQMKWYPQTYLRSFMNYQINKIIFTIKNVYKYTHISYDAKLWVIK